MNATLSRVGDVLSTHSARVALVYAQRYIGHEAGGGELMTGTYSDGASKENLLAVARAVKYPAKVEAELARLGA